MLFNSIDFAVFLPIVFVIYWFVLNDNIKAQNIFLILVSYVFYGWWDWRFLTLIFSSSLVDYCVGMYLSRAETNKKRRSLLLLSIFVNLGFLGFFKYYNFFINSFVETFTFLGFSMHAQGLQIILPVGISFYTFQTLSYSIDIYKRKLQPTEDIISFFAFVSFFPQLVAGPIERASNLLIQFHRKRVFAYEKSVDGMRQILWGLFKKMVIADNCAIYVNDVFANSGHSSGSTLLLGAFFFSIQIYGDFSGYSDIAIGTARLFGFDLRRNFALPYFSRDIAEFWRRWHISLSTWFRDYVYIPLGGSRCGTWMKIRNTFAIFVLSGLWHGANWTFIVWGILHALYFLPLLLMKKNRENVGPIADGQLLPSAKEALQVTTPFILTSIAWVFFRAESVCQAIDYIKGIFTLSLFSFPDALPYKTLLLLIAFIVAEWLQRDKQHVLQFDKGHLPKPVRRGLYYTIILAIYIFGGQQQEFIYFQF